MEAKASMVEAARTEWEAAASMVVAEEGAVMLVAEEGAVMLVEGAVTTER
jgi:hypothetical protein